MSAAKFGVIWIACGGAAVYNRRVLMGRSPAAGRGRQGADRGRSPHESNFYGFSLCKLHGDHDLDQQTDDARGRPFRLPPSGRLEESPRRVRRETA